MNLDFQDIYNKLLDVLPDGWNDAIFMVEYTSGSYSMRCYLEEPAGSYIDVLKIEGASKPQIIKTYKALNDVFQKERDELGESCWYAMTLKFDKAGRFSSDFDYNSHEEDVLSFIETWKLKHVSQ